MKALSVDNQATRMIGLVIDAPRFVSQSHRACSLLPCTPRFPV